MLIGVASSSCPSQTRLFADYMSATSRSRPIRDRARRPRHPMIMLTACSSHQIARSEGRLTALVEKQIRDLRRGRGIASAWRSTPPQEEQTRSILDTAYDAFVADRRRGLVTSGTGRPRSSRLVARRSDRQADEASSSSRSRTRGPPLGFQRFMLTGAGPL